MILSDGTIQNNKNISQEEIQTTPERKEVFEPGGDTDDTDLNNVKPTECPVGDTCNDNVNENQITASINETNEMENTINSPCQNNASDNNTSDNNTSSGPDDTSLKGPNTNDISNLENESQNEKRDEKVIPSRLCGIPRKQFSVDYFDVDDNGVEIQNPIFEEAEDVKPCEHLSSNHVVTTGLTQSDSSLSENPSYSYGNQTEYSYPGFNGQTGYCNPYMHNPDNNIHCLDSSFIHSLRNSELLSAEFLRRENGDFQTESFDESSLSCSRQNSVKEDVDRSKYGRMYSTDSYFGNPITKTSPFERSHSASPDDETSGTKSTDSAPSTRKPHIIPLHEYHRNSLKGTIDEDENA